MCGISVEPANNAVPLGTKNTFFAVAYQRCENIQADRDSCFNFFGINGFEPTHDYKSFYLQHIPHYWVITKSHFCNMKLPQQLLFALREKKHATDNYAYSAKCMTSYFSLYIFWQKIHLSNFLPPTFYISTHGLHLPFNPSTKL